MVLTKNHSISRSSSCLRKYRILFLFGITVLCIQIYLAHTFFGLEIRNRKSSRLSSGEDDVSQSEEDEGLPKGLRQLKLPPDKQINGNKVSQSQRNQTTRIKLDHKSLNFLPSCEFNGREAVSAVTRAQSQTCKQRIVNVTCLNQQGLLYPERIQSLCPHSPGFIEKPVSLGCFKDDKALRLLNGYYHVFKGNNSPDRCAFLCLQSGYSYAGTEYSVECFCGMEKPPQLKRLPDSSCNMKCPGNPKYSCGGYLTINVFWTGIQRFKAQEARNASTESENEKPIRIAYLLTVNGRASRQVKRLINILYHPSHLFYIHVDARQDYLYREMLEMEKSCKTNNIKVATGEGLRHASIWGGASLLTTLLKSAEQMLAHQHHWDFLVNLSESDFPIKSNAQLVQFLSLNKGMNFVKSHGREVQRFITKQGLDKTFVECETRMWRIGDRKVPNGIQIDGGSDWVALSRDFVEYVASPTPDTLVTDLLKVFKYTLLPAESFFHTVLRNSRFCNTYIDNNLHVTNWKRKLGCKCQYKAVVDWCGCSPNDFKLEDFSRIRNTIDRNLFFARKFESIIDQRIIDRVEEWLYPEKTNETVIAKGYDAYWQSLYHAADLSPLTDDAQLTISNSLARLVFKTLKINYDEIHLLETIAYFKQNQYVGILIHAEAIMNDNDKLVQQKRVERVEALAYLRRNFSTSKEWLGKIQSLSVNTDYDQKEKTFRNLVGSIGPYSYPILLYEFDSGLITPQNLSILWVDPYGRLADINYVQVEEMTLTGYVKPQFSEHLVVGTWSLLLVTDSMSVAKVNFLVTPLGYWKNKKIDPERAKIVNNAPGDNYDVTEEMNKKWSHLLHSVNFHERTAYSSGDEDNVNSNLDQWIDKLVQKHYEIDKICNANDVTISELKVQKCINTYWSSLSPDSKADISNLC